LDLLAEARRVAEVDAALLARLDFHEEAHVLAQGHEVGAEAAGGANDEEGPFEGGEVGEALRRRQRLRNVLKDVPVAADDPFELALVGRRDGPSPRGFAAAAGLKRVSKGSPELVA
jgi:hypothetical protein